MGRGWQRIKESVRPEYAYWTLIALGIVLRLRQYLANRSMWMDEASLALNIANRTFRGLTQPLDYQQGSPIGFLLVEKAFATLLGNHDYVLRLFPLLGGILAIFLIYRIARRQIGATGIFALLVFATSSVLVYYSSELKQYSTDVMAVVLLIYLALPLLGKSFRARDCLLLGAGGAGVLWISHPAAFVLAGIGLVLGVDALLQKDRRRLLWIMGIGLAWAASFGLEYLVSLRQLAGNEFLQHYWRKAFMPVPPWSNRRWFLDTYLSLARFSFNRADWTMGILMGLLAVAGGISLFIRERKFALVLVLPFFIALAACALQKYPLKDRFLLFMVPLVFLLMAEGLRAVYKIIARWQAGLALSVAVLAACAVMFLSGFYRLEYLFEPFRQAEIKPVLSYISQHRDPGDVIYVYHGSEPAFRYYAPMLGLMDGTLLIGYDTTQKKVALEGFESDVDSLKGKPRVWFIFSDIVDCGGCQGDMQAYYVGYLDRFGTLLDQVNATGANAYLFDLSK